MRSDINPPSGRRPQNPPPLGTIYRSTFSNYRICGIRNIELLSNVLTSEDKEIVDVCNKIKFIQERRFDVNASHFNASHE